MSARHKLNSLYFGVAIAVAVLVGLLTESFLLFVLCIAVFAVMLFHDGSIRLNTKR